MRIKRVVGWFGIAAFLFGCLPVRAEVMMQWFETDWNEMYQRMPKVAEIGYDYLWIPPPTKAPTGLGNKWSNVGYSLYDRFDIGDIPQRGSLATRYGTRGSLRNMVDKSHQLDIKIIPDIVANHNGNGPNILEYPGMKPTDFHLEWDENYANDLDYRRGPRMDQWNPDNGYGGTMWEELANLIDIRTEDHKLNPDPKRFTGPKTIEGRDFNFVDGTSFIRNVGQYDKYPYAGSYTNAENAADYLYRWIAWLGNAIDYDGLRLDAGKHIPYEFFGWRGAGFLHEAQYNFNQRRGLSDSNADEADTLFENYVHRDDALIFAEILSPWNEIQYWYGDGTNDRNPMRFLDYAMKQSAGASFNGDMSNLGAYGTDFGPNNGIMYVWGHDEGGPSKIDLAYAYILTHVGFPMVYFTGNNISWDDYGRSPDKKTWMIPGYDAKALGKDSGDIENLVWINHQFARGNEVKRWEGDGDFFALERYDDINGNGSPDAGEGLLLVCLNDSGQDLTKNNVTVSFDEGTVLHDYTGHAGDITVYNNGGTMQVNVTVPGNSGQGWVCYAPRNADAAGDGIVVKQGGNPVGTMTWVVPGGTHGTDETMYLPRITDTNISVDVYFDPKGGNVDYTALKWGQGMDLAGGSMSTDSSLVNYGYVGCSKINNTNWNMAVDIDADNIPEGLNVIKARVFNQRPAGKPALFNTFTKVVYVDRHGPEVEVAHPAEGEMIYGDCVAVISNADFTAYGMTVAVDGGAEEPAYEIMKGLWKFNLDGLSSGNHTMVVKTTEADYAYSRNVINTSYVTRVFNVTPNVNAITINHADGSKLEVPFFKTVVTAAGSPSDVKLYWDGYELPFNDGGYTNIFNGEVTYRDYLGNVDHSHLWGNFVNGQHFFEAVSVVGGFTNRVTRRVEFDLYGGVAKYGGHGTIDTDGDGIPDNVEMPGFDQGAPGPDQHWPGDDNNDFIPEPGENWTRLNPYNNDTFYSGQWDGQNDFDGDGYSNFEEVHAGYLANDIYKYNIYDADSHPSGSTTTNSSATWTPGNGVERAAILTVTYYPKDGHLKDASNIEMHIGHSFRTEGEWQDVIDTNLTSIGGGAWQANYIVPTNATSVDFTFWDGVGKWDGEDWHATVIGETNTFFNMDGQPDGADNGEGYTIFHDNMKILAAVKSNNLYVATWGVNETNDTDHFIYVTDKLGDASDPAPGWHKAGYVFVDTSSKPYLTAEGSNDWEGWNNVSGKAANANGGVLEGEINLVDAFGYVPKALYIAAVAYESWDGGKIVSQGPYEWVAGDPPNLDVMEFQRVPLASIRDENLDGWFDGGKPEMWTVVNGSTNDANYGLRRFFINELAGDSKEITVLLKPNVNPGDTLSSVELFSNINRRDFAVLPGDEDWDSISTLSKSGYYRAYEMSGPDANGVYSYTLTVNRCGVYRINARYKVNGGNYVYYTDNGLRRDCAVVVSPTKALALTMYELNPLIAEATNDNFYGRSTFKDMYIKNTNKPNVLDTNYYSNMGLNMIWLQPIHPIGSDGRQIDPVSGTPYDPGSPYAVKNYWKVNSVLGDPSSEAQAMQEFTDYVAELDARGVGVMLDGTFNHSAWDCEIGQIAVDMGLTYDVVSTDTNNVTTTNVIPVKASDLIRDVRPQWYSKRDHYGQSATYYASQTATDIAPAPDRIDFGKWNDAADFFFGRYACLVQEGAANTNWAWSSSWNKRFLREDDLFEGFDSEYTRELWRYFAKYPIYWLEKTGYTAATPKDESYKGIDGLRCDFAQGLPNLFWEYCINKTRSLKWDFIFMAESLDGYDTGYDAINHDKHHGVGYRSSRQFDVLNENMVFHWKSTYFNHDNPGSPDPSTATTKEAYDNRRDAFADSPILLNLTSHDEILPTANQWRLGYAYATVASMGGVPMVFYGQEAGAQNDASYYTGRGNTTDNNFGHYELNFGKSIPNFKRYNQMTNIWNNIGAGGWALGLHSMYERIGIARENSPALRSLNNYYLSKTAATGGGYDQDIFAVAKYQLAGKSASDQDVVFVFVNNNIDTSTNRSATYDVNIDYNGSNRFGIEGSKSYNLVDLMSTNPTNYVWSSNKSGAGILNDGLGVWLHESPYEGKQAQYLKLVDVNATYPDYTTHKDWDKDADGLPDWWEDLNGLDSSSSAGINGADGDKDGDGVSNMDEFRSGTNPDDPADYLRMTISTNSLGIQVQWKSTPDVNYQLETTEKLVPQNWKKKGSLRTANSTLESDTDYDVGNVTSRFYRVRVKQ